MPTDTGFESEQDFDFGNDFDTPHEIYTSPVTLEPVNTDVPLTGTFLLPVCTTQERLLEMLSTIRTGAVQRKLPPIGDYNIDLYKALEAINNPGANPCMSFSLEDRCVEFQTDASIITYAPQNPHTEVGITPPGYLLPPFTLFQDILPDFLPDWFQDIILDLTGVFTGYQDNDVLVLIGSFPLFANWFDILTSGLPRFAINVSGMGTLEIHFLNVPLGGRALVSVDIELSPIDIIDGILTDGFKLIELNRDYASVPPELDVDNIEEIVLDTPGLHTIYVTFLPVVNDELIPLQFGGGLRKIEWCADNLEPEPTECTIEELLADDEFFETEYVPTVFGDLYSETIAHNDDLNTVYDGTPQSIGADIPAGTPDIIEKNALCYAINSFVELYASSKLCIIQSKNFLEIAWNELQNAINAVYNALQNSMAFIYTPNLFSCFVDDSEAITVLQDASAVEDVACFLYDELSGVTISQSNFDDALLAAATTLTGNAGKLACVMQNDSNLTIYINFLEAYQIALNRVNAGDELECPCESFPYKIFVWDFTTQGRGESYLDEAPVGAAGKLGVFVGGQGWRTESAAAGTVKIAYPLNPAWVIRGYGWNMSGAVASRAGTSRPTAGSVTGATNIGFDTACAGWNNPSVAQNITGLNEVAIRFNATHPTYIQKMAIVFEYDNAKSGSVVYDDDEVCP